VADRIDRAIAALSRIRESLRSSGNRERLGRFSCHGCVAWCCREGFNAMRATPLEALAIARRVEADGAAAAILPRLGEAVERWRLDDVRPRTYTCPFLTAGNLCGIHEVKPLGCVTFTPVRDGGCDQDAARLKEAIGRARSLGEDAGLKGDDAPLPVAVARALDLRRRPARRR